MTDTWTVRGQRERWRYRVLNEQVGFRHLSQGCLLVDCVDMWFEPSLSDRHMISDYIYYSSTCTMCTDRRLHCFMKTLSWRKTLTSSGQWWSSPGTVDQRRCQSYMLWCTRPSLQPPGSQKILGQDWKAVPTYSARVGMPFLLRITFTCVSRVLALKIIVLNIV